MQNKLINDYINKFPDDVQERLKAIWQIVKEEAPEATETISYQMPTFKLNGTYLVYFAGFKNHVSIFPATGSMDTSADKELSQYRTGKGTFQFPLDKPLPLDVIRKIVKIRVKENLENKQK